MAASLFDDDLDPLHRHASLAEVELLPVLEGPNTMAPLAM
jgi:hypothetical protein